MTLDERDALIHERARCKLITFAYRYSTPPREPLPHERAALERLAEIDRLLAADAQR